MCHVCKLNITAESARRPRWHNLLCFVFSRPLSQRLFGNLLLNGELLW